MIANFIPFQDPQGGPNFYQFDQNALYEIHVDNNGDAKEDITFQFRFKNTSKRTALTIGGKQVLIPLINSSTISGVNPASLNVRETYTIDMVKGDRRGGTRTRLAAATGGATEFDKPVDNIGDKVFGGASGYETYANLHMYDIAIPGCGTGRVFVGQRKEPFFIAVGKIFDLFNLNPLGPEDGGNKNDLEGKNVSSIALEVPIACLTVGRRAGHRRLRHRQHAPGPPAQPVACVRHQHRGQGRRRMEPGIAHRHAAGERSHHRHGRQGPLQHVQAEG